MERIESVTQTISSAHTETYFSAHSITVSATSSTVYYPARSNVSAGSGPPTYFKQYHDAYKQVYRLPYPKSVHAPITREYVLKNLPQLNLAIDNPTGIGPIATSGGFANIYKVIVRGDTLAIKVMRTSLRKEELEKFERASLRELLTWSQLTHENILELLGYTFDNGPCISFVSKWQDNGNATDYLRGKDLCAVRKVLSGAVDGLKYLHEKNIVHGDVRGNNILIGQEGEALLTDFGFARVAEVAGLYSKSSPGGNIRWMAPELFKEGFDSDDECTHTKESDMWAIGMTILELCSSEVPYREIRRENMVLLKLMSGILPTRSHAVPELLWRVCNELWAIEPNRRLTLKNVRNLLTYDSLTTTEPTPKPDELLCELLCLRNAKVTSVVVESGILCANYDIDYWRKPLQDVLSRHCVAGDGGGFYATLLDHLVVLDVIAMDAINDCGHTHFHHLATLPFTQSLSAVAALLNHPGANINATDISGRTPLHCAVIHSQDAMLDALLDRTDVNINVEDTNGWTPLWYAVSGPSSFRAARRMLLHPNVNVNASADSSGQTLLHYAVSESTREVVQMLLTHKNLNVDVRDKTGRTPLSHSVRSGRVHNIEELLKQPDVDVNSTDDLGRTPLHYAVIEAVTYEAVSRLLNCDNIDVNIVDRDGRTALSYAAECHHDSAAACCLLNHPEIGVNLNSIDSKEGWTPLHYAIFGRNHDAVFPLLRFPTINIQIQDRNERTALSYAVELWGERWANELQDVWRKSHSAETFDGDSEDMQENFGN